MTAYTAQELEAQMPDGRRLLSDEPEMESSLHYMQLLLLVTSLEWAWRGRDDFFIGANLTIYFSRQQLKHRDFRGPDFFLVKNTTREPRSSWVLWEEDGIEGGQLRYFSLEGALLPTPEEAARAEMVRAEQETQRANQEAQRAERLADQLRALGVEPEEGE